ncbi:MAG: glycosyltransferase family 4 protein [Magnetospirillum sp.]|nr:glycosyltransferase family 4 protein [Magnetospirillum sp.]
MKTLLMEGFAKRLARTAYGAALTAQCLVAGRRGGDVARPWFGGARAGSGGGPRLKVGRLAQMFGEHELAFNLVYLLSNMPYLSAAALAGLRRRGFPIVLNQNGVFYPAWYGGDWRAMNRRMSAAYHAADRVLWQSDFCRRAAEHFLGPRQGPAEILTNAVDTARFVPAPPRPAGPLRFLVAGRIGAHQATRVTVPVMALAALRRHGVAATLTLAGALDEPVLAAARRLAVENRVESAVSLLGPYDGASAPALFAAHDVFVTLTHQDACPTAVIEAMACGLPVVHVTSGGVPELVGEAGVAVETGENFERPLVPAWEAVAEAMLTVVDRHAALSTAARDRAVRHFDLEPWLARHRALFVQLLRGRG